MQIDEDIEEDLELIEVANHQPRQYNFLPRTNFNLTEEAFRQRYRLSRQATEWLYEQLREEVDPILNRNHNLTGWQKVLMAIRFLACTEHYIDIGDQFGIDRYTVSKCVSQVVRAIVRVLFRRVVRWSENVHRRQEIRHAFEQ